MSDPTTVLPDWSATSTGGILRVQATSKLAFGATTAALLTLASGGTAVLVNTGTSGMSATTIPHGSLLVDGASSVGSIVVDRPAGSAVPKPLVQTDHSEAAIKAALAHRREPGRRTLTAPLVLLPVVAPPVVPAVAPRVPPLTPVPEVVPTGGPSVTPTVAPTGGGFHDPRTPHSPLPHPSVTPSATAEPAEPTVKPRKPAKVTPVAAGHAATHPGKGRHRGTVVDVRDHADKARDHGKTDRPKHARHGRHSR